MTKISENAAFQVYLQSLAMCMLQLPLMMLITTGLKCNSRLILRLLNNPELAQCPPPPPLLSYPDKGYVEAAVQMHLALQEEGSSSRTAACVLGMGLILQPYKDGIRAQPCTARKKIRVRRGNMWLIPSCHQWILKIFSHSVKLFVNHNGGTVQISSYFLGHGVTGEFKCGLVSHQCPVRPPGFYARADILCMSLCSHGPDVMFFLCYLCIF